MGNQLALPAAGSTDIRTYLHSLPDYVLQKQIGGGKVLKTLQCLHDEGLVVVKVIIKKDPVRLFLCSSLSSSAALSQTFVLCVIHMLSLPLLIDPLSPFLP